MAYAGLLALEARVQAPQPTLEQLPQAVFALRPALTQAVTERLVEQRTAAGPRGGPAVSARAPQERPVEALVGAIRLRRPYFDCERCPLGTAPLDEALQVTGRRKQPERQKAVVRLTTEVP